MKPHFIGIGGERCGTSWMYACLAEHPQLCMPFKTVNFFHRDDNFGKGFGWYEGHFRTCSAEKLVGEITTAYLYSENAPERIRSYHPEVKLFVSLRNPVDRALSHYHNEMMGGIIDSSVSFEQALKIRPGISEHSLYSEGLRRYFTCFSRERVLVLIYEDSLSDPQAFVSKTFQFLGVDPQFRPAMIDQRVNEGGVPRSARLDRALDGAANTLRRLRMQRLIWAMKKSGAAGFVRRLNIRARATPIPRDQRMMLHDQFEPDIRGLEVLLGRDLSFWRS